ncbi:tight adherence pilus pseudopilin TadF [Serratia sp. NA_112.1]
MNVRNLWIDQRASVAVEFVVISMVLFLFIFFLADLVMRQAMIGKLDRVSYSVAGVLRERIQLYDAREQLTQQDVDQSRALAQRILSDMDNKADLSQLGVTVEEIHFYNPVDLSDDSKRMKFYRNWHSGVTASCAPPQSLQTLQQLTPKGSYGRWVPLYQVTVCLPTVSWFTRLTTGLGQTPLMSSFSIVMLR